MSRLVEHAKLELKAIGYDLNDQEDGPNRWMMDALLDLLGVFSRQGHSGSSAPYCAEMFKKLALFEPLSPLTGDDDEWEEIGGLSGGEPGWQNKRCGHVFKGADGRAYDARGRVFRDPDGCCYTSRGSCVYVEFPYAPKTEYVDVQGETA